MQNSIIKPKLTRILLRDARERGWGRRRGRKYIGVSNKRNKRKINADPKFWNWWLIENPIIIIDLLKKVKASIYLSMKEYWKVPKLVEMIVAILDPWLKRLKFISNNVIKSQTIKKLHDLYSNKLLANELNPLDLTDNYSIWQNIIISSFSNSIITALFDDDSNDNVRYETYSF